MQYEKTKRNMILLLVLGGGLAIVFFWGYGKLFPFSTVMYSMLGILILLGLIFYPMALAYGGDQIKDLFYGIANGSRQPFPVKPSSGWNPVYKVLNVLFACVTVLFFGWAYGGYTAWQRLQFFKQYSQMNGRK